LTWPQKAWQAQIWHLLPGLALLVGPILLLGRGPDGFPYASASDLYSDFAVSHYPYALYLQQAIFSGRIPLWSEAILGGFPFAANPLSGMFYPPGWLALLLPLPAGLNGLAAVHVLLGGLGMYLLLRGEGLDRMPALLGGLAFELMPKLFAHFGAGHLTLVYAVAWTPWLLLAEIRQRRAGPWGWGRALLQPGLILGLILLADPRWGYYAAILWVAYGVSGVGGYPLRREPALSFIVRIVWQTGMAVLLAAPLLVPLLEFTRLSTRAEMVASDLAAFQFPLERIFNVLLPGLAGSHEFTVYIGVGIFILTCGSTLVASTRGKATFWLAAASAALAYAAFFPAGALEHLPIVNWLRVPSRSLFIFGMSMAASAAWGLQALGQPVLMGEIRRWGLWAFGVGGLAAGLAGVIQAATGRFEVGMASAGAAGLLMTAIVISRQKGRSIRLLQGLALAVCAAELLITDAGAFVMKPSRQVLAEGVQAGEYIAERIRADGGRAYSPSYSLPQQTAAVHRLELADGVDPLQLTSYSAFMEKADGVAANGYSVTLPPFANGDPAQDNQSATPDARLLGLLSVKYVAARFDLHSDGLSQEARFGETRIYRNLYALPRAWIQPGNLPLGEQSEPVRILERTPERVVLLTPAGTRRLDGACTPRRVVLADPVYPGWEVWVDGSRADLVAADGLLRSALVGMGEHEVRFEYRPISIPVGAALGCAGLLVWLGAANLQTRRREAVLE
jgi:hypothetical protein